MQGYLVKLGNDQLGSGDEVVGPKIGFNSVASATGSWIWSGVDEDGNTQTNLTENGVFHLGSDGNVYFVPSSTFPETITSANTVSSPGFDDRDFGTTGDDTNIAAAGDNDILFGGTDESVTGTGNDTLNASAGDDTVFGGDGNDLIIGSGGNDSLDGGTGDDVIYGDNQTAPTAQSESLNWASEGADGTNLANGFTQDTGTMNVTVNFNADGSGSGDKEVATRTQYTESGEPFADDSALFLQGDGGPNTTVSLIFNAEAGTGMSDEVSNISFRLNDIDIQSVQWIDVVTVNAYDLDGNPVPVTLTAEGDDVVSGQTVTGTGSGSDNPDLANGSALVNIAGPVHSIEIIYENAVSSGNQFLWITDVHFETVVDPDGADSISGGDGNDLIYGGVDDDIVNGDADQDTIFGGAGNDDLRGGGQADTVYGGTGNDTVDGDGGADTLFGDEGDDTLIGDDGNDQLFGGDDDDTLSGGNNNDTLDGGTGNDTAFGGAGNDTLLGTSGDDTLDGGTGNDQFNIADNNDQDTITGGEDAGNGDVDTVSFSNATSTQGVTVTFTGNEAGDYNFDGTSGAGNFVEIERLETTAFSDTIDGAATSDGITVETGAGDDNIVGGSGSDSIDAGTGADTIDGGAGDDVIDLGGPDTNPDLLIFADGDGADTVANFDAPIDNGDGTFTGIDMLDVSDLTDASGASVNTNDVTVGGPVGGPVVLTFPGGETITLQGITPAQLSSPFALQAIGIPLPDGTVSGSAGADTIDGTYFGDPDGDVVDNNDAFLPGDTGNDDLIEANGGNDSVLAGDGDDEIYGGTGDDTIDGGVGNDTTFGESGDDTAVVTDGFGTDTFTGGETGETTGDLIDASALTADTTVVFSGDEEGTLAQGPNSVAFSEVERIETGSGNDSVIGGVGDENVITGDGDDTVSGGIGSDTFDTGAGDDTITIAEGDSVTAGSGDDTFTLENLGETGNGTINIDGGSEDSATGDTLQLGDLADLGTLVTTDDGTGSLSGSVTLDDGTLLTFSEIETIICFTPGTLIATPRGARDIATLNVGDSVITRDHGIQKIRWIQQRTVPAENQFAPIRIKPGVLTGLETDIVVSPQHRMLFQGYRAELLFGETEVLVAAKHLVDGSDVVEESGGTVTYIHMMFDEHEIVYANGAASESFHPGSVGLTAVSDEAREELFALFPDLRSDPNGYGQTARRCLKKHETQILNI